MPEKPLLLSPAKSGVLIDARWQARLRTAAIIVGVLVVLIGAADLAARASRSVFGAQGLTLAFAPAIAGIDPSIVASASATSSELVPARLRVPSIGVDAPVELVGTNADGTMGTPKKFGDVAWYAAGGKPGGQGNAVFAGHVDNALTTSGVFEHLSQVSVGDYITVSDAAGKTLIYKVVSTNAYPVEEAPAADIFATSGPSQLVLITCTGEWVPGERQFSERLVVLARSTQ
jgi:LPXTG-site transpeptidase (sortase) family protein